MYSAFRFSRERRYTNDFQKWDISGCRRVWVVSVLDVQSLFFYKKNWICTMARYHAYQVRHILLTRNLPTHHDGRQWSHPLMIPSHCFWAKSSNRTRSQFACDVTWFCFFLLFFLFFSFFERWGCWRGCGWGGPFNYK